MKKSKDLKSDYADLRDIQSRVKFIEFFIKNFSGSADFFQDNSRTLKSLKSLFKAFEARKLFRQARKIADQISVNKINKSLPEDIIKHYYKGIILFPVCNAAKAELCASLFGLDYENRDLFNLNTFFNINKKTASFALKLILPASEASGHSKVEYIALQGICQFYLNNLENASGILEICRIILKKEPGRKDFSNRGKLRIYTERLELLLNRSLSK
jgi:hypothetical protein